MTTDPIWKEDAFERVNSGQNEVIVDFSSVLRLDGSAVGALEELAGLADGRSVRIVLRSVNADIYRVLKILGLTRRFGFVT